MKSAILLPVLGLAAPSLAACGSMADTTADTVTLNDDGGAVLDNAAARQADGNVAVDNAMSAGNARDNAAAPVAGSER